MYNPDYLERPYIVVLNKIDIPRVSSIVLFEGIRLNNGGIYFSANHISSSNLYTHIYLNIH